MISSKKKRTYRVNNMCLGQAVVKGDPERTKPCQRPATKGADYCFWHSPDRALKSAEKKPNSYLSAARRALLLEDSLAAVRMIAAGHADPMLLCRNVLNRFTKENGQ